MSTTTKNDGADNALFQVMKKASNPIADGTNPHFKSVFATLENVIGVLKPLWLEFELLVTQQTVTSQTEKVFLLTTFTHIPTGEKREFTYPLGQVKEDPQAYASAMTYARRNSLMAIHGLGTEDDDGNQGSNKSSQKASQGSKNPSSPEPKETSRPTNHAPAGKNKISEAQGKYLWAIGLKVATKPELTDLMEKEFNVKKLSDLSLEQFQMFKDMIETEAKSRGIKLNEGKSK